MRLAYAKSASDESERFVTAVLIFQRGRGLSPPEDRRSAYSSFFFSTSINGGGVTHCVPDIYYSSSVLPVFVSRRKRAVLRTRGQSIELDIYRVDNMYHCIVFLYVFFLSVFQIDQGSRHKYIIC